MVIGALLYDHKNHIYGDHLSALTERIKNNKLFSTAYNLYYLLQNKGSSAAEDLKRYSTLEFDAIWLSDYFRSNNLEDFQKSYYAEVITLHTFQVFDDGRNIYAKTKNSNEKLIIGSSKSIKNPENYILDEKTHEIKIISDDKEYNLVNDVQDEHYFALEGGYKVRVADVIDRFSNNKEIHDKLYILELIANRKEIEDIAHYKITDHDYDNAINALKQEMLKKGVKEEHFNELKDYIDNINDIENKLKEHNLEFRH